MAKAEGKLLLSYEAPDVRDLELAPVWHEYRDPDQLVEMETLGVSREWIQEHVIDMLERADVWFAAAEGALRPSEVMRIGGRVKLGRVSFSGFVTAVQQEVASVTVLEDLTISQADVLDEENFESLQRIAIQKRCEVNDLLPVRYVLAEEIGQIPREAVLDVPLPERG